MNGTITFESQNNESLSKLIYTNNQKLSFGLSVSAYSQIREIRFPWRLPPGMRETGAEIREIWQSLSAVLALSRHVLARPATFCSNKMALL